MTIWTTRTLLYSFGTICPEVSPAAYTGRLFLCPGTSRRNGGLYGIFRIRYHHFADPVIALGAGLGVWGVVNLLEGYGSDNPGSKSQGMKQLMAGGGIIVIGTTLIPLLSGLF